MLVTKTVKTADPQTINKQNVKNALFDDIYTPSVLQKSDKVKVQEANILSLQKTKNLKRILEAYGDCV